MNNLTIRKENKNDNADIIKVIKQAFENTPHSDNKEHILTEKIKKTKNFIPELSIVSTAKLLPQSNFTFIFQDSPILFNRILAQILQPAPLQIKFSTV